MSRIPKFQQMLALIGATLILPAALPAPLHADVKLPGFFGDHMVLQRKVKLAIWGWAKPGEAVIVEISAAKATTKADDTGKWRITLPAMEAGGPHTLKVSASNTIELKDILIGELWLCSGQSNMEWPVRASTNARKEIAEANYPKIRHIKIAKRPSAVPLDDIKSNWQICSPATAGNFTAAGYFFARHLHKELNVPIGLINSSWGGTRVEPWAPPVGFADVPALKSISDQIASRSPRNPQYKATIKKHIADTEAWLAKAKTALENGAAVPPSPSFPSALRPTNHQAPTMLYNGMIHAMVGLPIAGAIWYQGESNHTEGMLYYEKKKALINGWRKLWGIGDFPFYFVQIAPFRYGKENPHILARFWEAQAATLAIPNTGMAVTHDIATLGNIHPPNKQDVGLRLALLALRNTYGKKDVIASGPTFKSLKTEGDTLRVTFDHAAGGLKTRDGKTPDWFEIIGPGSGFVKATAKIDGDSIILSAPDVNAPAALRFAWHMLAEPNLVNGTGLPAAAFRAGQVPRPDFKGAIKELAGYQLVYDLNLDKLGAAPRYDTNRSAQLKDAFDRIAYLMELQDANGKTQYVYVSMDAFTDDPKKIAIPTAESGALFQIAIKAMNIQSNAKGITAGTGLDGGRLEFWPHNYAPNNGGKVPGASDSVFDFGDQPNGAPTGYGSMQIHNATAKQTLFALNKWTGGQGADLGIGNSPGKTRDWTFTSNAGSYPVKRLRIFVRVKK